MENPFAFSVNDEFQTENAPKTDRERGFVASGRHTNDRLVLPALGIKTTEDGAVPVVFVVVFVVVFALVLIVTFGEFGVVREV